MERGNESRELPWIFLSHSGQQKGGFVTHLYHALLHAKHRPFFDKDSLLSLPSGLDYPPRIFRACHASKMGVIVLSEDYVRTLWPMLELQLLLQHPGSADRLIYPLFYLLQPSDLSNPANLQRWQECWAKKAPRWQSRMLELQEFMSSSGCELQINLDIRSWPDNLRKLQHRSGEVRNVIHLSTERKLYQDDHDYIQAIVSNICASLPSPRMYSLDDSIKGGERMQQEIVKVFEQKGSMGADEVSAIGVHGIGGSGKSTLCKTMTNFYSNEFPGRCFYFEFPSNDNEIVKLVVAINSVLPALSPQYATSAQDIDQGSCWVYFGDGEWRDMCSNGGGKVYAKYMLKWMAVDVN